MSNAFAQRHIGTDAPAQAHMLAQLGYTSIEQLIEAAIPEAIHVDRFRKAGSTLLPEPATERETLAELRDLASKNTVRRSFIGQGYYDTITPAVIKRNVLENPSWYTAYTPYQPEISQGRLEAIINFQTMVTDLTGLATANGSMLDEGTAAVEAMLLARRASKADSNVFVVDSDTLEQTKTLIVGRVDAVGIEVVELDLAAMLPDQRKYYAYEGSLTSPPCTEGVSWMVMKATVPVSKKQKAEFRRLFPRNVRPVQPLHGRVVKESL